MNEMKKVGELTISVYEANGIVALPHEYKGSPILVIQDGKLSTIKFSEKIGDHGFAEMDIDAIYAEMRNEFKPSLSEESEMILKSKINDLIKESSVKDLIDMKNAGLI